MITGLRNRNPYSGKPSQLPRFRGPASQYGGFCYKTENRPRRTGQPFKATQQSCAASQRFNERTGAGGGFTEP